MSGLMLSPHLSLDEFLGSSGHPDLVPLNEQTFAASAQLRANAIRLAVDVFEPARALLGPLHVSSGFRCDMLNRAVGGAGYIPGQRPSAHMDARAVDVEPLEIPLQEAARRLVASGVPYEKLIWERGRWLHLQVPRHGEAAPRQALMWFGGPYLAFNPEDPRVLHVA